MKNFISIFLSLSVFLMSSCTDNPHAKKISIDSLLYNLNDSTRYNLIDTAQLNRVDTTYMHTGFYFITKGKDGIRKRKENSEEIYSIAPEPFASVNNISKTKLEKTKLETGEIYNELCLIFDTKGTEDIRQGTRKALHDQVAVIIANRLIDVARVEAVIKTGVVCIGLHDYTDEEIIIVQNAVNRKQ